MFTVLEDALRSFTSNPTLGTLAGLVVVGLGIVAYTLGKKHLARADADEARVSTLEAQIAEIHKTQIANLRKELEDTERELEVARGDLETEHAKYTALLEKRIADQDLFLRALEKLRSRSSAPPRRS